MNKTEMVSVPRELFKVASCPCCDGSGGFYDGDGEVCQCQWCFERNAILAQPVADERVEQAKTQEVREAIARAIWNVRREDEDRCDMDLEDMGEDHSVWREADAVLAAPIAQAAVTELVEALEHARQFIRNGIDLGFIRMPDADTDDPAHETLPKIEAALSIYRAALADKGGVQ